MSDFDSNRDGTGTMEWAEVTENIQLGCVNNCKYCFAAYSADKFKRRPREDWAREELTNRAKIKSYPAKNGVIMIPSSHDITPFNIDAFCRVAKLMLAKGNRLLIVSKPRIDCIVYLCEELKEYKDQILFRFTIGSINNDVLKFWEPGAPDIVNRIQSLETAQSLGFRTSVSAEPLLGGYSTAYSIVSEVGMYVTDTIWIGKLNKGNLRIYPKTEENIKALGTIHVVQNDDEIKLMVKDFTNPKIRWKDSIKQVIAK